MKERNKKEEDVSTRESTNLTESKIIISSPNLMLFSRIFMETKWLQPHINAKNYQYFYQKYPLKKNQPQAQIKIQRLQANSSKSIIFKKFVSIKSAGQTLRTLIRSRLATDKPQPKLKFSHLLIMKEYLHRFDLTKIKKIVSLNLHKPCTNNQQKESSNRLGQIHQDLKWTKQKDSKGIKAPLQAKANLDPIQEENYGLTLCRPQYKGHIKQRSAINLYQPRIAGQKPSAKVFQKNSYLNEDNASTCNSKNRTPQRSLSSSRKINPTKQVTLKKVTKKPSFIQGKPSQKNLKA